MEKLGVDVESYRVKAVGDAVVRDSAGAARFAPDAMLRVGRDVLRALRSLAEARIVHNDIKPTNILFGDGSRRAHLADYGMATECDAAACDAPDIRYGGGTPLFASLAAQGGLPTTPADDLESVSRRGTSIRGRPASPQRRRRVSRGQSAMSPRRRRGVRGPTTSRPRRRRDSLLGAGLSGILWPTSRTARCRGNGRSRRWRRGSSEACSRTNAPSRATAW